ncbi:hypothetical protein SAMN04487895_101558 [Paenibacillus sophorae]|uniref:Uncharacterized protein n=1 Tax=Paenibacillus sophorae TaxID=1333845 RepID=A0A1H8GN27_9BACL|nr:hypothetical protein SAMN04487895_101558 [Paenibacillus sophorae]
MNIHVIETSRTMCEGQILNFFDILSFLKNDCTFKTEKIKAETENLILFEGIDSLFGKSLIYVNRTTKKFYISKNNKVVSI